MYAIVFDLKIDVLSGHKVVYILVITKKIL